MRFFYDDSEEDVPPNSPEPQVHPVQMNVFVGSDHSIDRIMRKLQTEIILYFKSAPIYWYFK